MTYSYDLKWIPVDENPIASVDILGIIISAMDSCIYQLVRMADDEELWHCRSRVYESKYQAAQLLEHFNFVTTCEECNKVISVRPDFSSQIFEASIAIISYKKLFKGKNSKLPRPGWMRKYLEENFSFSCSDECPDCKTVVELYLEDGKMVGESSYPIILEPKKIQYRESNYMEQSSWVPD